MEAKFLACTSVLSAVFSCAYSDLFSFLFYFLLFTPSVSHYFTIILNVINFLDKMKHIPK
jgi:hypothetical protein